MKEIYYVVTLSANEVFEPWATPPVIKTVNVTAKSRSGNIIDFEIKAEHAPALGDELTVTSD